MKFVFVVNPVAGKGNLQKQLIPQIETFFAEQGGDYEIHVTTAPGDAENYARQMAQTGEEMRIFACGGEGTAYGVINGIFGYENAAFGVIPCGSANDFLKYFENAAPFADLAAQTTGEEVAIDLIKADDRYCFNGCSVGMDAMVARDMSLFKRWPLVSGKLAYKLAIARNFFKVRLGVRIRLSVDDSPANQTDCLFAVIANAPYYGGGYKGAPDACPCDGELDFTVVQTIGHAKVLGFLPNYEKGEFSQYDFCTAKRCKKMSFTADKAVPINMDGEIFERDSMTFSLVPAAIRFVVPKGVFLQNKTNNREFVNKT